MRIAYAEVAQETDSFSPLVAEIGDFEAYGLYFGAEVAERMQGVGPIGGFLEVAAEQSEPLELVPIIRAWGSAGGTITAQALSFLTDKLVEGLKQALPLDAVFLSLHGAAASAEEDDVEGYVLNAVRQVVGHDLPVVVALDHHANITQRMVDLADTLIGHETQPHDPPATGRKAARVLFRMLRGEIKPTVAWRKIPMITPQDQFLTSAGPMKEWFDLAREMERRPRVLDASPYPMQPWLDVKEGGWAVVVHTDNDEALAESLADELADKAWTLREQFWASERVAPQEAVRQAVAAESGLIILSDTGDSVYGGAPGDNTVILQALLAELTESTTDSWSTFSTCSNSTDSGTLKTCPTTSVAKTVFRGAKADTRLALVPVVDPEALRAAMEVGVGGILTVELGGKVDNLFSKPVRVVAQVAAVSTGFVVDLGDRGVCDLQKTALLAVGPLRIALLGHRSFAINHPVLYQHLGLDISDAQLVVLKTASNFQFFVRWRKGLVRVDSAGTTQSDLRAFNWQRVPRPMYPLDAIESRLG